MIIYDIMKIWFASVLSCSFVFFVGILLGAVVGVELELSEFYRMLRGLSFLIILLAVMHVVFALCVYVGRTFIVTKKDLDAYFDDKKDLE